MSQNTSRPGSPLLSWDDIQGHLWLSRPAVDSRTESRIDRLLSASSYPLESNDYRATASSDKKRGRPLKDFGTEDRLDSKQRRRLQIRRAQRAYQFRREAHVSFLNRRITQLETSVQQMSAAVGTFKEQLAQARTLDSCHDLALNLQDTVQECLTLANDANMDDDQEAPKNPENFAYSVSTDGNPATIDSAQPAIEDTIECSPLSEPEFDLSTFIERLHIACVYQGYMMLSDPFTTLDYIRRRFRLLLSIMDRETLGSFFEAALHARIYQTNLEQWGEVPLFSLGDAGTHYRRYKARSSYWEPYKAYPEHKTVKDPLSRFSHEIQEELSGEWFDICDLEEYLHEKGVCFLAGPSVKAKGNTLHAVNTAKLMKSLVSRAICLGRAPGFRRVDVEEALHSCSLDVNHGMGEAGAGST